MKTYSKGRIVNWNQGRYECLECGKHGRLKSGFMLRSKCQNCSSWMILPLQDFEIISNVLPFVNIKTKT